MVQWSNATKPSIQDLVFDEPIFHALHHRGDRMCNACRRGSRSGKQVDLWLNRRKLLGCEEEKEMLSMADFVQSIMRKNISSRKRPPPPQQSGPNVPPLTPAIYPHPRIPKLPPRDVHKKTPIEEHGKLQVVGSEAHRRELKSLYSSHRKGFAVDVSWEARQKCCISNRIE